VTTPAKKKPAEDAIKIDKDFAALIPPLSADELAHLENSLLAEGCRDPLVLWKGHDTLLDGHNRLKLCRKHGLKFKTVEIDLPDKEAARAYIIRNQLSRRNLTPEAASYLRGKRYLENRRQGVPSELPSGQTDRKSLSERLAEEYKVGEKTIRRDGHFAKAVDAIAEHCGDEARKHILSRESGLTRGNVLRVSKLPAKDQKKYMEELITTGKRPRRQHTRGGKATIVLPREPKALAEKLLKQLGVKGVSEVSKLLSELIAVQQSNADQI